MNCAHCGREAGNEKFCPNCGLSVQSIPMGYSRVEEYKPISAYKSMFKKYAQFTGRSRRSEYWYALETHFIISFILFLIFGLFVDTNIKISMLGLILLGVYSLATFIPFLALNVRRLHDTGRSGWFFLIRFIPYVGRIIYFVFTVLDSESKTNKYGDNPKAMHIPWQK